MTMIDENTKAELIREIATTLARKQRLAFASDFHALTEGRTLILAGVPFENFPKGPNTRRSEGDVVAHAIVMALAGATNTGDIDDWFPDQGEPGVRSMEYLPEMRMGQNRQLFGSPSRNSLITEPINSYIQIRPSGISTILGVP